MPNDAHTRATVKYNRERVDRITIKPDKETGARIRQAAQAAGLPLQRWIVSVLMDRIGQDDSRAKQ